jgi:dephospho-CoA kinase
MQGYNMKIIGITGKIGAGKTLILDHLRARGDSFVVESDVLAKELYKPGRRVYTEISDAFGDEYIETTTSEIDRKRLAALVFSDEKELEKLNAIVHPAVKSEILYLISEKAKMGVKYFFIEAALLIQDGYREICDEIWFVRADERIRMNRLVKSRGYSEDKCRSIFTSQPDDEYYISNSDRVLDNTGEPIEVLNEIDSLL